MSRHIVHQGKHDQIVIDDGKDETPEQAEGRLIRDWRVEGDYMSIRQLSALLGLLPHVLSNAENGRLSLEETKAIHERVRKL